MDAIFLEHIEKFCKVNRIDQWNNHQYFQLNYNEWGGMQTMMGEVHIPSSFNDNCQIIIARPMAKDFTLPHIFQVDSTAVQVHFFGWEHSQIGMHNPPEFYQDSRWTPDEPHGVSGVHLPDSSVDSTWTQSRVNPPGVQVESV